MIALITPLQINTMSNPGWGFITAGIKHYLRKKYNDKFMYVDMLKEDRPGWEMVYNQASKIVFCGNPRFNSTEEKVYWDWGIWSKINHAISKGIGYIDAWAGTAFPFNDDNYNDELIATHALKIRKNVEILKHESKAELLIARDKTTEILFRTVSDKVLLLPCCSALAKFEYKIESLPKLYNVIILRKMPGYEWILDRAVNLKKTLDPCHIITHDHQSWQWARSINPLCINEPIELLKFYAQTNELHSFRVHASIPAYSVGAKVYNYHIDSRSTAMDLFPEITSIPFTLFGESVKSDNQKI